MRWHVFPVSVALLVCVPAGSTFGQCPPPPQVADESKESETEAATGVIAKLFLGIIAFKIDSQVKEVLRAYPNADQAVVALRSAYTSCTRVMADTRLSVVEKFKLVGEIYDGLKDRAKGPTAIASTATRRRDAIPAVPEIPEKRSSREAAPRLAFAATAGAIRLDGHLLPVAGEKPPWADLYLNPVPIVITDKNKYFVIVGSAASEASGRERMADLKRKHPKYDFELFAPYGTNRSYGIMIATWTSAERAHEALEEAKKIDPTSFIWACRGTGDEC